MPAVAQFNPIQLNNTWTSMMVLVIGLVFAKFNPISHGVFHCDIVMGGVLKTHSLRLDLTLSHHYDNQTM